LQFIAVATVVVAAVVIAVDDGAVGKRREKEKNLPIYIICGASSGV